MQLTNGAIAEWSKHSESKNRTVEKWIDRLTYRGIGSETDRETDERVQKRTNVWTTKWTVAYSKISQVHQLKNIGSNWLMVLLTTRQTDGRKTVRRAEVSHRKSRNHILSVVLLLWLIYFKLNYFFDPCCSNDVGSFQCACRPGYTGDGKNVKLTLT